MKDCWYRSLTTESTKPFVWGIRITSVYVQLRLYTYNYVCIRTITSMYVHWRVYTYNYVYVRTLTCVHVQLRLCTYTYVYLKYDVHTRKNMNTQMKDCWHWSLTTELTKPFVWGIRITSVYVQLRIWGGNDEEAPWKYTSLLQNIVSFIGLLCKRDPCF